MIGRWWHPTLWRLPGLQDLPDEERIAMLEGARAATPWRHYVMITVILVWIIAIGVLAAPCSFYALQYRSTTRVDDTLDVFACHGVAGIVGALLTGVFASKAVNPAGADGLLAGNPTLVAIQLAAVVATVLFAGLGSIGILTAVRAVMPLRITLDAEMTGIDVNEHGEEAYHGNDLSDLAGRSTPLGDAVVLSASEIMGGALIRSAS